MNVPSFIDVPVVDKSGNLTDTWRQIVAQLLSELQINVSNEGLIMPSKTAIDINFLNTLPQSLSNGTMLYDSTNNLAKVVINGLVKTIQTV